MAGSYRRETEQLFRAQLPETSAVEFQCCRRSCHDVEGPGAEGGRPGRSEGSVEGGEGERKRRGKKVRRKREGRSRGSSEGRGEGNGDEGTVDGDEKRKTEGAKDVSREPLAKGAASPPGTGSVPPSAGSDSGAVKSTPPAVDAGQSSKAVRCPSRPDGLAANVYFRTDSVSVSEADRERLATLGKCLRNRRVSVIGHADRRQSKSTTSRCRGAGLRRSPTSSAATPRRGSWSRRQR